MFLSCRHQRKTWLLYESKPVVCLSPTYLLYSCGNKYKTEGPQLYALVLFIHCIYANLPACIVAYIKVCINILFVYFRTFRRAQLLHPNILLWHRRRRSKGPSIKSRSLNNGSLAWTAWGEAICRRESGVPLSAIVECEGRLMRTGWFL